MRSFGRLLRRSARVFRLGGTLTTWRPMLPTLSYRFD